MPLVVFVVQLKHAPASGPGGGANVDVGAAASGPGCGANVDVGAAASGPGCGANVDVGAAASGPGGGANVDLGHYVPGTCVVWAGEKGGHTVSLWGKCLWEADCENYCPNYQINEATQYKLP